MVLLTIFISTYIYNLIIWDNILNTEKLFMKFLFYCNNNEL